MFRTSSFSSLQAPKKLKSNIIKQFVQFFNVLQ